MQSLDELITASPVFAGLPADDLALIAACGTNERVGAGIYLLREGDPADRFYLVRHGRIALVVHAPGRGDTVIETLSDGDVLGWSWLFAPHRWQLDGRTLAPCSVITFDGLCLREKCEADPRLGYALMSRFAAHMLTELQAVRFQLLDVYGDASFQR
ncbi:MAG: cyclic nucleotide-binding domain-containing protein [Solirubrobacteraceae bacterium]